MEIFKFLNFIKKNPTKYDQFSNSHHKYGNKEIKHLSAFLMLVILQYNINYLLTKNIILHEC